MERHEEGRWYRRVREVCDWVWRKGRSAWRRCFSAFPVAVTVGIVQLQFDATPLYLRVQGCVLVRPSRRCRRRAVQGRVR
jgi:hypothetical protein